MKELVIDVDCFNLKYTLECGQCFRWKKELEDADSVTYTGVIKDRVLRVTQKGNKLYVLSDKEDNLLDVVRKYFDLNKDYRYIESEIGKIDNNVKDAVKNTSGIRHLNQDLFETIISFIISANNNIPRISKSISLICKRYGRKVIFDGDEYYLFPTINRLSKVTEKEFKDCGVGFRDNYLVNTIKDIADKKFDIDVANSLSTSILRKNLINLKGVGPKVADCILLFSCNRGEVFPIDVWVERVMSVLYFKDAKGTMTKKEILDYANKNFGKYAGIVQQHLFYNIREGIIKV